MTDMAHDHVLIPHGIEEGEEEEEEEEEEE